MAPGPRLRILYPVETLLPPRGGAELFALELLAALAKRHDVTALFLAGEEAPGRPGVDLLPVEPPPDGAGYWATKRLRREAVAGAVRGAVAGADVVASTLHAGPGAVAAAADAGVPAVLFLHSYEPLCKYAFDAGARCDPASGCLGCPSSAALTPAERAELAGSRREHEQSLAAAAALVATSATVAAACEEWTGRRPVVAAGVAHEPARVRADARGHVLLAAARWTPNKGSDLLEPLADALPPRPLAVTEAGLGPELASRLAARPHVRVVPNAPIADLLDGAAALLVPSQWSEPFGRVAFEGLAAGVPTLAAGVGGLTEFVPAEQLVIPADRPERWRDALESLAHPGAWEAARERGMAAARRVLATDPIGRIEAVLAHAAATGAPAAAGTVSALGDQS